MKTYKYWSDVPSNYKTQNNLIKMGIYQTGPVVARVNYHGLHDLYDLDVALKLEQKKGNKSLNINPSNQEDYLIMEMATTGDSTLDEIIQLVIINMNGSIMLNQYFKPTRDISKKAQEKYGLNKNYLKNMPMWFEFWPVIKTYLANKTVLIPNTTYGVRLFEQTCEKYKIDLDFQINYICSRETIQHKFTLMDIFTTSTPMEEIQNPVQDAFDTLKMLYPKSPLYKAQALAKQYFERLCQAQEAKGEKGVLERGYAWLQREFRLDNDELNFSTMEYNTCAGIVNAIGPTLKQLGCLK